MLGGEAEHRENERGTGEQKCQNYESQSARALLQCFDFCCLMAQMILQSDFLCALKRGTEAYAEALGHSSLKSIFGPCSIRGGAGAGAVRCVVVPAPPGAVLLQQATLFFLGMWVLVFCCFFFFSFSLSHPLFGSHWKLLPRERGSLKKAIGTLLIEHEGCSVPAM